VDILLREATPSDAAALAAIGIATSSQHEMSPARYAEDITRYPGAVYVAELADSVVGYLMLRNDGHPHIVEAQSPVQVWRLYVLPEFQGKGVAASLMSRALEHARGGKHDVVWLGVSEDNDRAIAFYGKQGFRALGMHRLHGDAEPHDDLVMCCPVR
jgi:ribosomal protein S18 acetylase RimI-like enzyme